MATLQKIRNKAGVLIAAIIGLALFAFILGDLLDSRKSVFFTTNTDVAEIAGKSVNVQEFEQKVTSLTEIYKMNGKNPDESMTDQIREQAWQQLVNDMIMEKEYARIGLTVSADELYDQIQGQRPNAIVRQLFPNPQTGEFNKTLLMQFLKSTTENPNSEQMKFRLYMETEIRNERISTKYNTLISKGLSAPTFLAKNDFLENNKKVDFNYIVQRYNTIADKDVALTTSDLKEYYNNHKYLYDQTASRDIEYVSFDVTASKEDKAAAQEWIEKIKPDFVSATEVEQFVNGNSDVPYNDKNYKPGALPDSLSNFMFKAKIGDIYGPYVEGGSYKLARLYKVVSLPDSVKARHILIAVKAQTKADADKAKSTADSLMKLLNKKGTDFAALAKQYSDDKGSAVKGGDLGWFKEGMMVKPFNDAAFEAKKNEYKLVETQYGYHIIQVLDKGKDVKKVKVAFVERKIEPSQRTYDKMYAVAMKFASENRTYDQFVAAANKQKLFKKQAVNIGENDKSITGVDQSRSVVKWVYKAKKSEVSEPYTIGDHYIVAALADIKEKGIAPLEQVKSEVELAVRKQKKAEKIIETIKKAEAGTKSIQDLALKLRTPVETASGIAFSSFSLPNPAGIEPKVVSLATSVEKNKLSEPVDGNNGVFVVYVSKVENSAGNISDSKMRLTMTYQQRASYECNAALHKLANIVDKRSKFF